MIGDSPVLKKRYPVIKAIIVTVGTLPKRPQCCKDRASQELVTD